MGLGHAEERRPLRSFSSPFAKEGYRGIGFGCVEAASERGTPSGCGTPLHAPDLSLRAILQAARRRRGNLRGSIYHSRPRDCFIASLLAMTESGVAGFHRHGCLLPAFAATSFAGMTAIENAGPAYAGPASRPLQGLQVTSSARSSSQVCPPAFWRCSSSPPSDSWPGWRCPP